MLIENGSVNPALLSLIQTCGLTVVDESPSAVNGLLQREWVKTKDGAFRVQIGGRDPTEGELGILSQLGFVDEIPIDFGQRYEETLVLGATLKAVVRRMWFVMREKIRSTGLHPEGFFRPICFLGTARPLSAKIFESWEHLPGILREVGIPETAWQIPSDPRPETESCMMDWIAGAIGVPMDVSFSAASVQNDNGTWRFANTDETIRQFLSGERFRLVVSSQPFCMNQLFAVRRIARSMGDSSAFDVVGPAAPPMPLARWLDTVAKQLWEEVQLLPK